jgi:hypothetical protein
MQGNVWRKYALCDTCRHAKSHVIKLQASDQKNLDHRQFLPKMRFDSQKAKAIFLVSLHSAIAQQPPLPFGDTTGDFFTGQSDDVTSRVIPLARPMTFLGKSITTVTQNTNGFVELFLNDTSFGGTVFPYNMDIDACNGGPGKNELWLRAGTSASDLLLAVEIIAGNGTIFNPLSILGASWFKVEAFDRRAGAQNTFQLAMAYSATGEIFATHCFRR